MEKQDSTELKFNEQKSIKIKFGLPNLNPESKKTKAIYISISGIIIFVTFFLNYYQPFLSFVYSSIPNPDALTLFIKILNSAFVLFLVWWLLPYPKKLLAFFSSLYQKKRTGIVIGLVTALLITIGIPLFTIIVRGYPLPVFYQKTAEQYFELFLYNVFGGGVLEEIIFRLGVLEFLRRGLTIRFSSFHSNLIAMFVSASFFGFIHSWVAGSSVEVLSTVTSAFIFGIIYSYLYVSTDSLMPSTVAHATYNAIINWIAVIH